MPGVQRMMLDRDGGEVARATSLVRYAPNSTFSAHTHGGGEEFLVLDGEFGDEHGRYGSGVYARNPIGTSHSPVVGAAGALILVKLHQFSTTDTAHFTLDTTQHRFSPAQSGVEALQLHQHGSELVRLVRFAPIWSFQGMTIRVAKNCSSSRVRCMTSMAITLKEVGFDRLWDRVTTHQRT